MTIIESNPIVLTADAGHRLTQAADVTIENRIVTSRVELAVTDAASNWMEITEAQAQEIRQRQAELRAGKSIMTNL